MSTHLVDVAIVGAGLGGCALALALSAHGIAVVLYESRPDDPDVLPSGVVLTPNGLRILDRLGVFARIRDRCYVGTHRTFMNDRDEIVRKTQVASESTYGYCNHRLWRKVLLDEMKAMLSERAVPINYGSKFGGIVFDGPRGVDFLINDQPRHATLLIGADGIYSSVRKHIVPDVAPEYTGTVGILAHIKRASVSWPYDNYDRNATIQGKPSALFFIPEDPQAVDIMIGMQVQYPQQTREDLERLQMDKDKLVEFYRKDFDEWGPTARQIIDSVTENKDTCYIWPYLRMPELPRWYSESSRVIILGDAAHALPPSSGQGVNQALEDVYSLTLLLTSVAAGKPMEACDVTPGDEATDVVNREMLKALSFWQSMRQKRIDDVFDWATNSTNVERLPEAERRKKIAEGKMREGKPGQQDDMRWLYGHDLNDDLAAWVDRTAR